MILSWTSRRTLLDPTYRLYDRLVFTSDNKDTRIVEKGNGLGVTVKRGKDEGEGKAARKANVGVKARAESGTTATQDSPSSPSGEPALEEELHLFHARQDTFFNQTSTVTTQAVPVATESHDRALLQSSVESYIRTIGIIYMSLLVKEMGSLCEDFATLSKQLNFLNDLLDARVSPTHSWMAVALALIEQYPEGPPESICHGRSYKPSDIGRTYPGIREAFSIDETIPELWMIGEEMNEFTHQAKASDFAAFLALVEKFAIWGFCKTNIRINYLEEEQTDLNRLTRLETAPGED
ncbi:hypothetical protein C8J56DRAFT_888377 [Mycena floridula]|nr:hypothetical protein C8J56DRAFT_888377 [Mycena floridula]